VITRWQADSLDFSRGDGRAGNRGERKSAAAAMDLRDQLQLKIPSYHALFAPAA